MRGGPGSKALEFDGTQDEGVAEERHDNRRDRAAFGGVDPGREGTIQGKSGGLPQKDAGGADFGRAAHG
jgi:hypothetical protein